MVVLALVMSFIIKKDSEVIDYEDAFGEMKTVDDINLKGMKCLSVGTYRRTTLDGPHTAAINTSLVHVHLQSSPQCL